MYYNPILHETGINNTKRKICSNFCRKLIKFIYSIYLNYKHKLIKSSDIKKCTI